MGDLVERLRDNRYIGQEGMRFEAADELESQALAVEDISNDLSIASNEIKKLRNAVEESIKYAAPIVECKRVPYRKSSSRYVFYCEFCKCKHTHSPEAGHRAAHCTDSSSPYKGYGGYVLMVK